MKEPATPSQRDYVRDLQAKAATQVARQIMGSIIITEGQIRVRAPLKLYIDYIAFSTLPSPKTQGEATSLISMYTRGPQNYESSLAAHERLYSEEAWAAQKQLKDDDTFQSELADFIRSLGEPGAGLIRNDVKFRSSVLDPFRSRQV